MSTNLEINLLSNILYRAQNFWIDYMDLYSIRYWILAINIKDCILISPDTHFLFMDMIRNIKRLNSHKSIRAVVSQDEGSREHLSQTNLSSSSCRKLRIGIWRISRVSFVIVIINFTEILGFTFRREFTWEYMYTL